MATIEALNVKSTIEELFKNCKTNITVYNDSSSAKSITARRGVTRKTKHIELRQLFVQEMVANGKVKVTKVGTLSNPADIFTKFVSSETIQRQLHAVGLQSTKLIHAIHAIRCVPSDFVEVSEKKAHEIRAMAMLNYNIMKFLQAKRPKYDVKTFGDPHRMAMKIANDDEFQTVYTYQVEDEKASITDLLKVRRIGIPYATQMKMIRVWEIYERSTSTERKECQIPQWYGKAIRYDGYELNENLTKATFYEPPHLTILDKVLLTNTKMTKAGKPTNEYVFVPLDIQYDEENEIMNMCKYSHLVFHENYETAAVFGALMMPTRGTLTILAIWKQSFQTTLDKMIKNCRGRYQVWYEDRDKAITFCCVTPGMTDYTTVFEIDEETVTTVKKMAKCEVNTKLHWSIFNDHDAIFPTQIAYRAMTKFSYAKGRAKNGCPICVRLVTDDYKTYRDVQEMPDDNLTNMIRLVSEPYWPWRSEVIDNNANLDDSQSIMKTDDSNKDKDEQEPKGLKLTTIPERREGVLNDSTDSEITS